MKKDIEAVSDIELLVNAFYQKLQSNTVIGYIFRDSGALSKEKFLPAMVHFWENTLFFTGGYAGNPLKVHKNLNKLFPLNAAHFNEWNKLFIATVDELFKGEMANLAKERANGISAVMQSEILEGRNN
ncbi:MAG TPA: group III truncated hemoglobin [Ferruginibacter sp.]|nr:group III truncated hemoglobin [Ferruginibacter sp.]